MIWRTLDELRDALDIRCPGPRRAWWTMRCDGQTYSVILYRGDGRSAGCGNGESPEVAVTRLSLDVLREVA